MRRFVALSAATCCLTVFLWLIDASPADAGAVAGDIGSTMSVGVSSPGSTGVSAANGNGASQGGSGSGGTSSSQSSSGGSGNSSSGGSGGSSSASACTYQMAPSSDQTVAGPAGSTSPGNWYLVECKGGNYAQAHRDGVVWVPTAAAAAPAPGAAAPANPAVDPAVLAQQAENSMQLPSLKIQTNPSTQAIVNLPTWLWLDQGTWNQVSVSASLGTVTATATATPEQVEWTMGDGGSVVCNGPGTAYQPSAPAASQSTNCSYTYSRSSAGEPSPNGDPNDAGFPVTATITWGVSWTAQGVAAGGTLHPLTTSSSTSLPVQQIESVSTNG
jgi:hypothetical protein